MYALGAPSTAASASPLHAAAATGDISEMKKAIAKASSRGIFRSSSKESLNIDIQDANGMTPLMVATARGHLDLVQFLLDKTTPKPNLNLTDIIGWTAVHHGVNEAQLHVVVFLIEKGANLTFKTRQGETALHLLIKSAFAPSKPQYEALIGRIGKAPGVSWNGSITDVLDGQGETALHIACSQGNEKAVVCLLENNSDPNILNPNTGETALHVAVRLCSSNPKLVRVLTLLLNYGATTSASNLEGFTPIQLAEKLNACSQVVEILNAHDRTRTEREEQIKKRRSENITSTQQINSQQSSSAAFSSSARSSPVSPNDRKLENMVSQLKNSIRLQKHISQRALTKDSFTSPNSGSPPSGARAPGSRPSPKTTSRPSAGPIRERAGVPGTTSHSRSRSEQVPAASIQRISTADLEPIKKGHLVSTTNVTSTTSSTPPPIAHGVATTSTTTLTTTTTTVRTIVGDPVPIPVPESSPPLPPAIAKEVSRSRSSSLSPDPSAVPQTQLPLAPPASIQVVVPQGGNRSRSSSVSLIDEQEQEGENARSELLHALRCQSAYIPPTLLAMLESEPVSDYKEVFLLDHQEVRLKDEIPNTQNTQNTHAPKLFRGAIQVWQPVFIQRVPYTSSEGETIKHMLEDEMEMLKQVHHPHLVSYLGSTVEYNWISIATECTEGGSLADLLVQESCFSEAFAANVLIQILEGLIYLHKRKIVHKALTPANILFTQGGKVKLANYLSSTKILSIESQKKIDPDFTVLDPNYTAPEVVNTFSFSPASDIWSLGSCLVEMLTGKPPFDDYEGPAVALQVSVCTEVPVEKVTLEKLTKSCVTILKDCFKSKPEERPLARNLLGYEFIRNSAVPEDNLFQTLVNLKEPESTRVIEEEVKAYQRQLDEGLKWLLGALDANNRKRSRRFHAYVKDLVSKVKNDTKLKDLQAIRFHLQYAEELMQRYQDFTSSATSSSTSAPGTSVASVTSSGDSLSSASSSSNTGSGSFTSHEREVEVKTTVTPTLINLGDEDDDDYDEEGEDDLDLDDLDLEDVDFHGW